MMQRDEVAQASGASKGAIEILGETWASHVSLAHCNTAVGFTYVILIVNRKITRWLRERSRCEC